MLFRLFKIINLQEKDNFAFYKTIFPFINFHGKPYLIFGGINQFMLYIDLIQRF